MPSLVGSEMCIRDRHALERLRPRSSLAGRCVPHAPVLGWRGIRDGCPHATWVLHDVAGRRRRQRDIALIDYRSSSPCNTTTGSTGRVAGLVVSARCGNRPSSCAIRRLRPCRRAAGTARGTCATCSPLPFCFWHLGSPDQLDGSRRGTRRFYLGVAWHPRWMPARHLGPRSWSDTVVLLSLIHI